ncbi:hypothetical protein [Nocardia exalbida]|uniref:hypothetical protein n=1 Tax=Nocardia exalbida TaxID=290231 RepID=UPI0005930A75|nr:hypothetical protein [Nocardia exalbida]
MEPEADPFAGMTNEQRKRIQERIMLEFVYHPDHFAVIQEQERPDFALAFRDDSKCFGVEVTQLFPNETYARLHSMPGYMQSLWDKTRSPIKEDAAVLDVTDVRVTGPDGVVKYEAMPVIITKPHTRADFHAGLAKIIEHKSGLDYDFSDFSHINLVVLDWFHVDFNAQNYSTDLLLNSRVRSALRATPFREVHLLIYDTGPDGRSAEPAAEESVSPTHRRQPILKRVALKKLLLVEQFCLAYLLITERMAGTGREQDAAYINELTCGLVTRSLGIGTAVILRGIPHVRFGAAAIGLSESGITLLDDEDWPLTNAEPADIAERLLPEQETELRESLARLAFMPGTSMDTHEPPSRARLLRHPPD